MSTEWTRAWPSIGIRMKKWWWFPFVWMIDAIIQGGWVLYRINKNKGDDSLPLRAFWRHTVKTYWSTWYAFWNISMILANVWPRNVRLKNWRISSFRFRSIILVFGWHFFLFFPSRRLSVAIWFKHETYLTLEASSEAYSEQCQTSKMEVFAKIVNGFSLFTVLCKKLHLRCWQDSEFASEASNDLWKKLHLSCLTGFLIVFNFNYFCKIILYFFTKFD